MAFLRDAGHEREPVFRAPLSVIALIAIIVAAHVLRVFLPAALNAAMLDRLALVPQRYLTAPGDAAQVFADALPFAGYLFLHANATHLIVNCLWLLAFGAPVARRLGATGFLVLFFLSGIAGAAAHVASNWGSPDAAIGASGAIAGVMAAGIRMVWLSDPFGRREGGTLLPIAARQVAVFSLVWIVANVVTGLTGIGAMPGLELVAWQAHIGGYVAGLVLAGPLDRLLSREPDTSIPA